MSTTDAIDLQQIRKKCRGILPLDARVDNWMQNVISDNQLFHLVEKHGSPLNILCSDPFHRNAQSLYSVAEDHDVNFEIYFARKANKCLLFVEEAQALGCGIDVASEVEMMQVLDSGFASEKIICTAAVKSERLLQRCLEHEVTIAIDNLDELAHIQSLIIDSGLEAKIAMRLSGFRHERSRLHSRFGFDVECAEEIVHDQIIDSPGLKLVGLHFHLDGYCRHQRITALKFCIRFAERLASLNCQIEFIDIGGGLPMSYLEDREQWDDFWNSHHLALIDQREPLTYNNHGLGFRNIGGSIHGHRNTYPYWQTPTAAQWLKDVLNGNFRGETIAAALKKMNIQLRCEPGRSILNDCGMTVARVEFRKQHPDDYWFIGLAMNRTQCRTSSDDFLVDPLLIPREGSQRTPSSEGFLVGAYCTESELLSLRRLQLPEGVGLGDLVVFPNSAGYFMHFLESRSHQFPLAQNVVYDSAENSFTIDRIDV